MHVDYAVQADNVLLILLTYDRVLIYFFRNQTKISENKTVFGQKSDICANFLKKSDNWVFLGKF